MKFGDVGKEIARRWATLPEEQKAVFKDAAAKDRERAASDKAAYVPPPPGSLKRRTGFSVPQTLSPALSTFLGGAATMSRSDVVSRMWAYFKEHKLQVLYSLVAHMHTSMAGALTRGSPVFPPGPRQRAHDPLRRAAEDALRRRLIPRLLCVL